MSTQFVSVGSFIPLSESVNGNCNEVCFFFSTNNNKTAITAPVNVFTLVPSPVMEYLEKMICVNVSAVSACDIRLSSKFWLKQ